MGLREKIKRYNKRIDKYNKHTKKRKNRLIWKNEEAVYIGVTASLLVAIIFTLFDALEIFLNDMFGLVGYPVVGIKIFLALVLFVCYTIHLQMLIVEKGEKGKK